MALNCFGSRVCFLVFFHVFRDENEQKGKWQMKILGYGGSVAVTTLLPPL